MAIPAGHKRCVFAKQALRADDHILQDALHRMANMHIAIGIRRAIMKDELLTPAPKIAELFVKPLLLPPRQNARLLLREASFHGEIRFGQENGVAIINWFRHRREALGEAYVRFNPLHRS